MKIMNIIIISIVSIGIISISLLGIISLQNNSDTNTEPIFFTLQGDNAVSSFPDKAPDSGVLCASYRRRMRLQM
jgi:hypothetical protein